MINGGPDPLFVKAMVVPSREVVVRFSPVDITVRPPEYRIASMPNVTMTAITTTVVRFIAPPACLSPCFRIICSLNVVLALRDRGQVGGEVLQSLGRAGIDAH